MIRRRARGCLDETFESPGELLALSGKKTHITAHPQDSTTLSQPVLRVGFRMREDARGFTGFADACECILDCGPHFRMTALPKVAERR